MGTTELSRGFVKLTGNSRKPMMGMVDHGTSDHPAELFQNVSLNATASIHVLLLDGQRACFSGAETHSTIIRDLKGIIKQTGRLTSKRNH